MFLKNNSTKIIGIGLVSILPGETEECPTKYEKNPVIQKYIENGTFTVVKEDNSEKSDATENNLEEMTEEELMQYALEHGIDTGKATTREGILKKIQDAMS